MFETKNEMYDWMVKDDKAPTPVHVQRETDLSCPRRAVLEEELCCLFVSFSSLVASQLYVRRRITEYQWKIRVRRALKATVMSGVQQDKNAMPHAQCLRIKERNSLVGDHIKIEFHDVPMTKTRKTRAMSPRSKNEGSALTLSLAPRKPTGPAKGSCG